MNIPRLMIAAPKSGSGKTLVTCALLQNFRDMGMKTAAFKCGPDYIDPMFHRQVIGVPSQNLDTYFVEPKKARELFTEHAAGKEISLIEGVMGLYDGLGGIRQEASSYEVAEATGTPVILVLDVHGMGRSILPLAAGFLQYDKGRLIKGVVLNRTTETLYDRMKPLLETETGVEVLGYVPNMPQFSLESRHLGLRLPSEIADLKKQVNQAAGSLKKTVDIQGLLELAGQAEDIFFSASGEDWRNRKPGLQSEPPLLEKPQIQKELQGNIAVARDEAFCFYYEDNLRLLEQFGAKLVYFSPLREKALPANVQGLLLGGGYPELYAKQLAGQALMQESIRQAIASGMPSVAECGGFLYLMEELIDPEGNTLPMAGVIPQRAWYTGKPVRFGYIELQEREPAFLPTGTGIRGHEFHYYDSTGNGECCQAVKPVTNASWPCVYATENHWWGFPHLYYPSNPQFAAHFVKKAKEYGENRINRPDGSRETVRALCDQMCTGWRKG